MGWVGVFRYFANAFEAPVPTPETSIFKVEEPEPIPSPPAPPEYSMDDKIFTPPQVDENNPEAFDPEGVYTVTGFLNPGEQWSEGFSILQYVVKYPEIESMTPLGLFIYNKKLDVDCDDEDFGKLEPPTGVLFVNNTKRETDEQIGFDIPRFNISEGMIKFSTVEQNGVSFNFDGEFLVKGNFYTLDPKAKVLEGTVTRIENGKKVAETKVSFTWSIDLTCVC